MLGLVAVNNLVLSIKVTNNTSWVVVCKINVDELVITDTRSDSKGVTCSLSSVSCFVYDDLTWLGYKTGNRSSFVYDWL